ncbi:MAG: glycosyltransferase family 2 protein [Patescibacteria group bacterium]|jgi:glycosyltransferase involved in cell wall biosynthesis
MIDELISIVIPTHNRSEILANVSVPSVINQIYKNWELIIVDDGSTDNTREVCVKVMENDSKIKYYYKENGGQGSARNFGIRMAKGDFVLLLDSDDALLPEMINIMLLTLIYQKGDMIKCRKWDFNYGKGIFNVSGDNPSCHIYRKELFEKMGFYGEDRNLIGIEDADLTLTWNKYSAENGSMIKEIMIDMPLVVYLSHVDQATSNANLPKKKQMIESILNKYHEDLFADKREMFVKYRELGNIKILLGDSSGRKDILKSLSVKFNIESVILLAISYLGKNFYRYQIGVIKKIRERVFWKIAIKSEIKKFPLSYKNAMSITKNYKDWR